MSRLVGAASLAAAALSAHLGVNLRLLRTPGCRAGIPSEGMQARHRVSVLLPARDEAARIAPCVRAVLASQSVALELLVLDDGSADGTADVVRAAAGEDPRVRLLTGTPPPAGWLGKPHACAQLAEAATGEILAFIDADVRVAPHGLAATVALLADGELDLVSPYPRQLADGVGPRLVQPLLQWSWLTFLPLRLAETSAQPSLTAANGQLLACRAAAYDASGGHGAVRDRVLDDVELARAFKRAGYRAAVADGTALATCRMYDDWTALADGYTKSLWAATGSPAAASAMVGLLGWIYLLPPAAAVTAVVRCRPRRALVGLGGYAAAVAGRLLAAHRTGARPADALAHPASVAALLGLTAASWWRRTRGQLSWKGRAL